jgi:uncharacterized protein YqgC (DUF456 family)
MDVAGWVIIGLACVAGYVFTVAPILPGTLLVPVGAGIGMAVAPGIEAWSWWWWGVQGALVAACMAVDNVAQIVGVQRLGASSRAMWGGVIGVVVGPVVLAPVSGPFALMLGPLAGAVAGTLLGEVTARRRSSTELLDVSRELAPGTPSFRRLGLTAAVAWIAGTSVKLVLLTVQVTIVILVLA